MVLKHLQSTEGTQNTRVRRWSLHVSPLMIAPPAAHNLATNPHLPGVYFSRELLLTCFAGHSHHALLLLPKADVILECQEIKKELKKKKPNIKHDMFIIVSLLNRHN